MSLTDLEMMSFILNMELYMAILFLNVVPVNSKGKVKED